MSIRMFENKKGNTYEVRFSYKDKYGRKQYYSKRGFTSERKARKHEEYMKVKLKENKASVNKKTFNEVFYEAMKFSDLKPNTIGLYKEYYKLWIKKEIGAAQINLLDYAILQNLLNNIGKEKSLSVCKSVLKVITYTFKYAYNNSYIDRIPYAQLKTTGKTSIKKNKIINEDDYIALLNYANNNPEYKIMFQIAYYTGMRIGEILALEKNDIDFYNNTIEISKNLYFDKDLREIGISYPKTQESANYIPIPSKLKDILKEYVDDLSCDIIVNKNGDYIKPSNIYNYLHKFNKSHNTYITMHMFRHTYTSRLYEHDVDVKEAQRLLRHKHFSTTMDTYTHLKENKLQDTIDKVFN